MGYYTTARGTGRVDKPQEGLFLTQDQVWKILNQIEKGKKSNLYWQRDHAAIFFGFYFGLRISEACRLTRQTFRFSGRGEVKIITLKQTPRIECVCKCKRIWRVSAKRMGKKVKCSNCGCSLNVPVRNVDMNPPEKSPPVVEKHVLQYAQKYMATLPPEQDYLFTPRHNRNKPLSCRTLHSIFITHTANAGLGSEYSWHALRHGRGLAIWSAFRDVKKVQEFLRHKHISASERYVHLDPAEKQSMSDTLEGKFKR